MGIMGRKGWGTALLALALFGVVGEARAQSVRPDLNVANASMGAVRSMRTHQGNVFERIEQHLTGVRPVSYPSFGNRDANGALPAPEYLSNRFWAGGFYEWENQKARRGVAGFDFDHGGVDLGFDHSFGTFLVGGAFGYSDGWLKSRDGRATKTEVETFYFSGYGAFRCGEFFTSLNLAFGHVNNSGEQRLPGISGKNKSSYHSNNYAGKLAAGYNFRFGAARLTPMAGLDLVHTRQNSFHETGVVDLRYGKDKWTSFEMPVGVQFAYAFRHGGMSFTPELGAFWVHEWGGDSATLSVRDAGSGAAWRASGLKVGRDSFQATAGVNMRFSANTEARVGYEGRFGTGRHDHLFGASFGFRF